MTHAHWDRIKEVFNAALAVPQADRPALLDRLCAGDAELRREVESLLDARTLSMVRTGGAADALADMTTASIADPHAADRVGTIIHRYKLLQIIGEGGFGTVYLAEQTEPVRRKVALKVIKPGMDSRAIIARFEAERQALAMMDHPHIARVLDGGVTPLTDSGGGLPYFVMEYVIGDPITTFADAHRLSIADRLAAFQQVCSAVQHAHTKGIIHRDLKPANVIVSMVDDKPFAKVIDFGVAKATGAAGGSLTAKTLFTEHRQLIGTPEYMSPEQAEGSLDIDTRTDVYALGVLLYELLTGSTPIESERLRSAAFDEMRRMIREDEPPSPSLRLSRSLDRLARTAAARKAEPGRLSAMVRGELDWIVMKALEKERARRYETASALAEDVKRHLAGEAVVAAPVSRAYRVRKFVRKNKGAVGAVSAVGVALAAGGSVAAWQWTKASDRERQLQANANVVREKLEHLERVRRMHARPSMTNMMVSGLMYGGSATFDDNGNVSLEDAPGQPGSGLAAGVDKLAVQAGISIIELSWMTDAAEWSAYTANLALAQAAMDAGNYPEVRNRLADAPESKRGWEWRLWSRRAAEAVSVESPMADELVPKDHEQDSISGFSVDKHYCFVVIRDSATDMPIAFLQEPTGGIRHAFISNAGEVVTVGGIDGLSVIQRRYAVAALGGYPENIDFSTCNGSPPSAAPLHIAAILAFSPNGPSGLTITIPDGTRRIIGGADKTVRFYEAKDGKPTLPVSAEHPEGVYREVAVFRMPEAVTNLQMTSDGTRLIIHLEGGSARVWDIRDPEERRKDLQAEWAERVPAGAYLDTLWASDTPDDQLRDAVINDASLTPLRRLVAAEMLEERLEDDRIAAEQAFEAITKDQTDKAAVASAAAAAELLPRVKARLVYLAEGWEYKALPLANEKELAAAATLLEAVHNGAIGYARARTAARQVVEVRTRLLGPNDLATAEALHALGQVEAFRFGLSSGLDHLQQAAAIRAELLSKPDLTLALWESFLASAAVEQFDIDRAVDAVRRMGLCLQQQESLASPSRQLVYLPEAWPGPGFDSEESGRETVKRWGEIHREEVLAVAVRHIRTSFDWYKGTDVTALSHIALVRWRLSATPELVAAAAEIDGKPDSLTGGKVLDREGHRAAAREALAKARALMAPAADGTPSPWANDEDAKALLAEAEAIIEGEAATPASPSE